ncbi:MAG TPA: BON domain-containing protein [Pirellulales bacterium]|nr:BON domain-containing protein [Pirellulales bacterium]
MSELTTSDLTKVEDVQPRAQKALRVSPIYALRELRVEQTGNALLISGLVASFYHKQLAQEVVRTVSEGIEVINSIHVL